MCIITDRKDDYETKIQSAINKGKKEKLNPAQNPPIPNKMLLCT